MAHPLIGKTVTIEWVGHEEGDFWSRFKVIGAAKGLLRLQGLDRGRGMRYTGGPGWAPLSAMRWIEVE